MESVSKNEKKVISRKEFREEIPKMFPHQALQNIKQLLDISLQSGILKTIEDAVLINKSLEILEDIVEEKFSEVNAGQKET